MVFVGKKAIERRLEQALPDRIASVFIHRTFPAVDDEEQANIGIPDADNHFANQITRFDASRLGRTARGCDGALVDAWLPVVARVRPGRACSHAG